MIQVLIILGGVFSVGLVAVGITALAEWWDGQ